MCQCLCSQIAIWDWRKALVGATAPVTRPCLAMRSRYFGTGSCKYRVVVWVVPQSLSPSVPHRRPDRDIPMWSSGPLAEPAPRGVTHVSLCLSRGYDESAESPSGFLTFPTVAITSRFRSKTPVLCDETPRMDSD